jgi:hypothetical protein
MGIDALRKKLDNVNKEIADLVQLPPVSLSHQIGDAEEDSLFLYGIAGGKDVGKTSMINQLAGAKISVDTNILDEGTSVAVAYCHRNDRAKLEKRFSIESGERFRVVEHDRKALKNVVFIDLPDFDSRFLSHWDDTNRLAGHLQGVIWVTTPRKYGDYQFLNQFETIALSHENYYIVLNKIDQLKNTETLDLVRKEVFHFLSNECVKRKVPRPNPEQFFILSALEPNRYEFNKLRDQLIRYHSAAEVTRAKWMNLKAEFEKNFERIRSNYKLLNHVQEIDQALDKIRDSVADQFSDDYFRFVGRQICALETLHRRISKAFFAQRVRGWPILRMLFYPLVGIISGLGGRIAFHHNEKKWPDSPRNLLRYKGLPASLRMQKIRDDIETTFPNLKPDLGETSDFSKFIEDEFVHLLNEYEDLVTERLIEAIARPGRLKRLMVYFPLIWFPFLQPLLLKFADMKTSMVSFANLADYLSVFISLFGAGSLLTSFVFLILFYTVWLIFIFAHCSRKAQKKGEEEFQNLWYAQFLVRLERVLVQPLLDIRFALSSKIMQLEQIESVLESEIHRMAGGNGAGKHIPS